MARRDARRSPAAARGSTATTIARFLGLFAVYVVAGHLLLSLPAVKSVAVEPWTRANVRTAAVLALPLGVESHVDGTRLWTAGGVPLEAKQGCDGITALLILATTILAFPAPWRARIVGLAAGTLAVFVLNAIRIATLLLVSVHWPSRLDFFHVDVWQPLMMLSAFGLFFLWGGWLAQGRSAPRAEAG